MNISQRLRTCARHTGLDAVIELLNEAADEIDRLSATQAAVTDAEIVAVMRDGNNCNYNDEAEHIQFARAILALRPERVPMTDLPEGDVTYFDGRGDAVDGYTAERVWEILRSHGITAQAKKEGA